ncbi:Glutamyl-tRNA(Gln) amidotransferase subunit A 1 [Diplonema papillatum]|nr:Glutamyl-tRNA(Gln) amidotransferase subunit A 1 [Diplonema papillatum]
MTKSTYDIASARFHDDFPPKELTDMPSLGLVPGSNAWKERTKHQDCAAIAQWFRDHVPTFDSDRTATDREKEMYRWSAMEYVAAFKEKKVTCKDYVAALVKRILHYKALNAFLATSYEETDVMVAQAEAIDEKAAHNGVEAVAPLYGLPVAVKGTAASKEFRSGCGTGIMQEHRAVEDAEMIKLIKRGNGVVLGLTNVPEFAASYVTMNHTNGVARNPHDARFSPGGSSGGSAVAVAARLAPLAVSEDTGGSTRHPASFNGVFGYDPLRNHFPNGGNPGLSYFADQIGLHARSVDDILWADRALNRTAADHESAKAGAAARKLRVSFPEEFFQRFTIPASVTAARNPTGQVSCRADAAVLEALRRAKETLRAAAGRFSVVDAEFGTVASPTLGAVNVLYDMHFGAEANGKPFLPLLLAMHSATGQMSAWIDKYFEVLGVGARDLISDCRAAGGSHDPKGFMAFSNVTDESQFRSLAGWSDRARAQWNAYFDEHEIDVMVTPTQFCTSRDLSELAGCTGPLDVLQADGSYAEERVGGVMLYLLPILGTFKMLPVPKLQIPLGKTSEGRLVGATLWGRSVASEADMYSDDVATKADLPFLHAAAEVAAALREQFPRPEPDLNRDLFA